MILVDYVKCDPQMQPRVYDNLKQTQSAPNWCVCGFKKKDDL